MGACLLACVKLHWLTIQSQCNAFAKKIFSFHNLTLPGRLRQKIEIKIIKIIKLSELVDCIIWFSHMAARRVEVLINLMYSNSYLNSYIIQAWIRVEGRIEFSFITVLYYVNLNNDGFCSTTKLFS